MIYCGCLYLQEWNGEKRLSNQTRRVSDNFKPGNYLVNGHVLGNLKNYSSGGPGSRRVEEFCEARERDFGFKEVMTGGAGGGGDVP